MRYVGQDELIQMIASAMRGWTPSLYAMLRHHDMDQRLKGRVVAAGIIADHMKRLEILTSAPEGPPVNFAALSGVSGIVRREEDEIGTGEQPGMR